MISTTQSDDIRAFLAFLAEAVDPGAEAERVGASASEVERFVQLAGSPLPPLYLAYLSVFGHEDRVLKMADDADPRLPSLIRFYEKQATEPDPEIPPSGVVIGVQGLSGARALLYEGQRDAGPSTDAAEPVRDVEPSVIVSWWGDVGHTCARTFRNHLYRQAFVRGQLRGAARASMHRIDPAMLEHARDVARDLGFQAYWFSDDCQTCFEHSDGTALYMERLPDRTSLYLCATHDRARDRWKDVFVESLSLQVSWPR